MAFSPFAQLHNQQQQFENCICNKTKAIITINVEEMKHNIYVWYMEHTAMAEKEMNLFTASTVWNCGCYFAIFISGNRFIQQAHSHSPSVLMICAKRFSSCECVYLDCSRIDLLVHSFILCAVCV